MVCREERAEFSRTLAPFLMSWLTIPPMFRALPGMALEENTTVSPGIILTYLCVPLAILLSAASASPCEPVHTMQSFSGGNWLTSSGDMKVSSGTSMVFICRPISTTFSMDLPNTQTFLSQFLAALMIWASLLTLDAKVEMSILPVVLRMMSFIAEATCFSEIEKPSTSALVESDRSSVTPAAPI